ncbi:MULTISPECIES: hypothetical protein [unclassified Streptomyces]|uniref:hypothetical protein n=1 Tax=unclassified Streptomyces TaxID=2593676 RepID=UPI0001C1C6D4|nr:MULTISPECIES: hypothetical protein [unclassified Streptomyces]AEN08000.1 hypothetical protein SACTE_0034 [Streptomyces sp. SirexAA-E]MYR67636.1 hypothetical protein [Streptomyces sp. SID4939]MYR98910.1 hypothetical protein [Streptomyces sp. SID4940]MYT62105.1 hypothetical protein [Streptomyces sp. SID8357]MYT68034.1 hypothetical protein [Streptomyces sp. SID8357]
MVVRVPEARVPVLPETDRRSEDAYELVVKLRRTREGVGCWHRMWTGAPWTWSAPRPDAIEDVGRENRLWRWVYPPTCREDLMPFAFVFADTTEAKVANTVVVLEGAGCRYWAPRRYGTLSPMTVTAWDYGHAVSVVVTTLERLQEHGVDAAVWRCLGRKDGQTLTAALDNPDSGALFLRQYARADAEDMQGRAAGGAAAGVHVVRAQTYRRALVVGQAHPRGP